MPEKLSDMRKDFLDDYRHKEAAWQNFSREADRDLEMYLGAQFTSKQQQWANFVGRTLHVFNKIRRQVWLIHGYEIRNRHVLKIHPVGKEDDPVSNQMTGAIMHTMEVAEGYDVLSQAFKWGPLISGSNLLEIWRDREGHLQFARRGHNSFLLDPSFTRPDLSDCDSITTARRLHKRHVKRLLPKGSDKIDKIQPLTQNLRWPSLSQTTIPKDDDMRLYEEWYQRDTDYQPYVIDHVSGKQVPFDTFVQQVMRGDERRAKYVVANMTLPDGMPALSKFSKPIDKVTLKIFVDGEPIWSGPNPLGIDDYPFVWLGGEWVPECDRDDLKLQSFVRSIREPQYARNKRLNQAIDIIESQVQSGKRAKEGALVNPEDAYSAGQGKTVWIKKDFQGALPEAIDQFGGVDIPAGVFHLLEVLDKEETEAGGMNEEVFGSDDKDIPGVLARYRTGQALTAQQGIFSGYRRAKRHLGRKLVKLIQKWYGPQEIVRLLNQMPHPQFYDPQLSKYDCTPTEGLLTDSQRHLAYQELKMLHAMFPEEIPASVVIEAAPIQYKQELLQRVKQTEQMKQQLMQAQLETKQRVDDLMAAQSAEEIAQARENRAGAMLDRAKAISEIGKMDSDKRMELADKYLKLLELMSAEEQQKRQMQAQKQSGDKQKAKK